MLKFPYKKYSELHIYNIDNPNIELNDNDLIGIWREEETALLFFHKKKDLLIKELNSKGINILFYNKIPYEYWESGKNIKSFTVGEYIIKPIWEKYETNDKNKTIYIDPSVAFGSGFHPTTRMILESFYNLQKSVKIKSCVDYGCGTGILSLFAKKLGIKKVIAIDNNNLAIEVTKNNLEINRIKEVEVLKDNIFNRLNIKVDIIFANLYYHLLEELFKQKNFWTARYYFLSGFIKEMEKRITKSLPKIAEIIEKRYDENWVMYLVKLRNNGDSNSE